MAISTQSLARASVTTSLEPTVSSSVEQPQAQQGTTIRAMHDNMSVSSETAATESSPQPSAIPPSTHRKPQIPMRVIKQGFEAWQDCMQPSSHAQDPHTLPQRTQEAISGQEFWIDNINRFIESTLTYLDDNELRKATYKNNTADTCNALVIASTLLRNRTTQNCGNISITITNENFLVESLKCALVKEDSSLTPSLMRQLQLRVHGWMPKHLVNVHKTIRFCQCFKSQIKSTNHRILTRANRFISHRELH